MYVVKLDADLSVSIIEMKREESFLDFCYRDNQTNDSNNERNIFIVQRSAVLNEQTDDDADAYDDEVDVFVYDRS